MKRERVGFLICRKQITFLEEQSWQKWIFKGLVQNGPSEIQTEAKTFQAIFLKVPPFK